MALVLTTRIDDDFYVGEQRFIVKDIFNDTSFTLHMEGHRKFEITEQEAVEVMDEVFISSGDYYQSGVVRVVIDAPREVLILRGSKYRARENERPQV
jgi:hypothetical protein